jgi:membrane protein involved in colicin uptake
LNISLDSLQADRFEKITLNNSFDRVMEGIAAAKAAEAKAAEEKAAAAAADKAAADKAAADKVVADEAAAKASASPSPSASSAPSETAAPVIDASQASAASSAPSGLPIVLVGGTALALYAGLFATRKFRVGKAGAVSEVGSSEL